MPINDDTVAIVQKMEEELGIPRLFYWGLVTEDDWSFVIKLHSLLEAAVSFHLINATGQNNLSDFFSYLDMSNTRIGKIAVVKGLGSLSNESVGFIKILSEIRNTFVHNIKNVNSTIKTYLDDIETNNKNKKKKCKEFNKAIVNLFDKFEQPYFTDKENIKKRPKHAIWIGALLVLQELYFHRMVIKPHLNIEEMIKKINKNGNSK